MYGYDEFGAAPSWLQQTWQNAAPGLQQTGQQLLHQHVPGAAAAQPVPMPQPVPTGQVKPVPMPTGPAPAPQVVQVAKPVTEPKLQPTQPTRIIERKGVKPALVIGAVVGLGALAFLLLARGK